MPTYDYLCGSCGHQFEEFQSMNAKSLRKCPKCKKSSLKRLIGSGGGIIFKGSGFYETDYKRASKPKETSGEGAKKSEDNKPKEKKKDSSDS